MTALPTAIRSLDHKGVLLLDAGATAATGALLAAGAQALDGPLGVPSGWLLGLGLFLLVFAADVALVAVRPGLRRFVPALITTNAAWVVASVLVVVAGGFELTALGTAFVLLQAAVVAALAVLQARTMGR